MLMAGSRAFLEGRANSVLEKYLISHLADKNQISRVYNPRREKNQSIVP
jgi:hypothetical protein